MLPISVVTLVHQREAALRHLIAGLEQSPTLPAELVIVYMNEDPYALPQTGFPVRQLQLRTSVQLPLAAARNYALRHTTHDHVIFLDADCIPHARLIDLYQKAFRQNDLLWMGPVRYLAKDAEGQPNWLHRMDELRSVDPVRNWKEKICYELFWSLNFGCSKTVFENIGGFDEGYEGYGAEDTDFAFAARERGVPVAALDAIAYHQHHASYSPPVNHMQDILPNALRFKSKWGKWPMEGWLRKFADMGLIEWHDDHLAMARKPTPQEFAAALKP